MAKEDNIVTYRNDKKIKEIKTSEKKFSLKHLYRMFKGSAAYVIGFLFSNKAWILFTGLTKDQLIKNMAEEMGRLKVIMEYEQFEGLMKTWTEFKIAFLDQGSDAISVLWNLANTYPVAASIIVGALVAGGVWAVCSIPNLIVNHHQKKARLKARSEAFIDDTMHLASIPEEEGPKLS